MFCLVFDKLYTDRYRWCSVGFGQGVQTGVDSILVSIVQTGQTGAGCVLVSFSQVVQTGVKCVFVRGKVDRNCGV